MTDTQLTATLPFTPRPRRAGDPEPDLRGFSLIHRALLSGTRTVVDACAAVAAGEPCPPPTHDAIIWFARHVLLEIHGHHRKEDDVLWPVIAFSAGEHIDLEPLTGDHRALEPLLARADGAVDRFAAESDAAAAGELAAAMREILDELDEHIADEEAVVFPVLREYVSAEDFARCEKKFQKGVPLPHLVFILPWIMTVCTAQERAEMVPEAPLALRVLLRSVEGRWQRRVALIDALGGRQVS